MNPSAESSRDHKYNKVDVKFEHPANGMDRCIDCIHFLPTTYSCKIVRGRIEPRDWCSMFKEAD